MVNRLRIATVPVAIMALAWSTQTMALYQDDVHISSDRDIISADVNARVHDEIRTFLDSGYPIQSVYLHGVALGFTIDDIVYLSVSVRPDEAERYLDVALDMLPTLPAWACRDQSETADARYAPVQSADELGPVVSLSTITSKFFDENIRLSPMPEWTRNHAHLRVPTNELADLVGDGYWYRNDRDDRPVNEAVFVSLYRYEQQVVVDGNLGQVRDAIERGDAATPVVVIYNNEMQRPVSDFGEGPRLADVVGAYLGQEISLTSVPDWRDPYSDYQHTASIEEFEEFTTIPTREEIDDARWDKIVTELRADGFQRKPVIVSMYFDSSRVWVDQPDRLTAARELGMETVPVVYLHHSIDRLPCGVAPGRDCEERIRRAAELASQRSATARSN